MQPAVLAILVAYNSAPVLPACLASLQAQQGVVLHVVVVDNASPDDSAALAAAAGVQVVRSGVNEGFAKGCNRGWHAARSGAGPRFAPTHVLFVNPDVRIDAPGLLRELADRLAARPDAAMVTPRLVREDGSMDLACRRDFPTFWNGLGRASGLANCPGLRRLFGGYNLRWRNPHGSYPVPCITGAFMFCSEEFIAATGGFDERFFMYLEDVELCWQARERGRAVWFFGDLTAVHAKGHASRIASDAMLAALFHSTRQWFDLRVFPSMGPLRRAGTRAGLWAWERLVRVRNRLRRRKSAQP